MTAALEGGEWSAARPGRTLPRGRPGTHFTGGWSGMVENFVPTGIRSRTVQPVVSRFTDWATGPKIRASSWPYYKNLSRCRYLNVKLVNRNFVNKCMVLVSKTPTADNRTTAGINYKEQYELNGNPWYWQIILNAAPFLSFCKYLALWWPLQAEINSQHLK